MGEGGRAAEGVCGSGPWKGQGVGVGVRQYIGWGEVGWGSRAEAREGGGVAGLGWGWGRGRGDG